MHTQTLLKVVTIINTVKAMSFQVGKRHLCIKNAAFRISIGSFFDIKKTYLSLAFQYLSDLCLTNLKRLSLSTSCFIQETRKCSSSSITLHTEHYMYHSVKITCVTHVFEFVSRI
jgi:hypothetical protein